MGFEPMRISPVELKSTDLTKLAYPRSDRCTSPMPSTTSKIWLAFKYTVVFPVAIDLCGFNRGCDGISSNATTDS